MKVLASKEKTFGPDDAHIIAPLKDLSFLYSGYKIDLNKNEAILRRTLAICDKS